MATEDTDADTTRDTTRDRWKKFGFKTEARGCQYREDLLICYQRALEHQHSNIMQWCMG